MNVSYCYCCKTDGTTRVGCHRRSQQKTKNKWSKRKKKKKKKTSDIQEARERGTLRKEEMSNRVKSETEANESQDQKRFFNLGIAKSPMTPKRMSLVAKLGRNYFVDISE